jgi:hypothetical protein
MRTVSAGWRALAAGVALGWALAPAWAAPAAPSSDKDKDQAPTAVEKVRKALDAPVTLKIDKQPLTAAIDMLKEKGKVNVVLDTLSIQQQLGWVPEQPPVPVDVDLKDVKLKSALRTILSPYSLSYVVLGDTVLVTTEQTALMRQMHQRVNIDLDKVEFNEALKQLSRETAANLILDSRAEKEAKAPVSLQLEDVPLETAVRLLAEMAGLKPVRIGNVLFVTKKEIANELRNDPDLSQVQGQQVMPNQDILVQQQLQLGALQGGVQFVPAQPGFPGGVPPGAGVINPPGIQPAVPPAVAEKKTDENGDKPADPKDDKKDPPKDEKKEGDK